MQKSIGRGVVCLSQVYDEVVSLLQKRLPVEQLKEVSFVKSGKDLSAYLRHKDLKFAFVDPVVIKEAVEHDDGCLSGSSVSWIHSSWAGADLFCKFSPPKNLSHGIGLTRTSGEDAFGVQMAEFCIGAIIGMERRMFQSVQNQHQKEWEQLLHMSIPYRTLSDVSIGVVGATGEIGRTICSLLRALRGGKKVDYGMSSASSTRSNDDVVTMVRGDVEQVLANSDYVVFVLPSTKETKGILNGHTISKCKKGCRLINVGRGDLVDSEHTLVDAIGKGFIDALYFDVWPHEPLPRSSKLWDMENVFVSPHCSGNGGPDMMVDAFLKNWNAVAQGKEVFFKVDWEKGY